jgi:2,3-bisphosphoglycerate-independent phosphoglycerate mutase
MRSAGGHVLVTADHGNADDMGTADNPHTAHTTNPVPFVSVTPGETNGDASGGDRVRGDGGLADVAPTILGLLDVPRPPTMTGDSLLLGS